MNAAWHKDIDYKLYRDFSKNFIVKVENVDNMDVFLSQDFKSLVEKSNVDHIESNGEAIMIFDANLTFCPPLPIAKLN